MADLQFDCKTLGNHQWGYYIDPRFLDTYEEMPFDELVDKFNCLRVAYNAYRSGQANFCTTIKVQTKKIFSKPKEKEETALINEIIFCDIFNDFESTILRKIEEQITDLNKEVGAGTSGDIHSIYARIEYFYNTINLIQFEQRKCDIANKDKNVTFTIISNNDNVTKLARLAEQAKEAYFKIAIAEINAQVDKYLEISKFFNDLITRSESLKSLIGEGIPDFISKELSALTQLKDQLNIPMNDKTKNLIAEYCKKPSANEPSKMEKVNSQIEALTQIIYSMKNEPIFNYDRLNWVQAYLNLNSIVAQFVNNQNLGSEEAVQSNRNYYQNYQQQNSNNQ